MDGKKNISTSSYQMVMKTSDSSISQGLFGFFGFFHLQEAHKTTHQKHKKLVVDGQSLGSRFEVCTTLILVKGFGTVPSDLLDF